MKELKNLLKQVVVRFSHVKQLASQGSHLLLPFADLFLNYPSGQIFLQTHFVGSAS